MIEYYDEPSLIARGLSLLQRGRAEVRHMADAATPDLPWMNPMPPEGETLDDRKVSFYKRNPAVRDEIARRLRIKIAERKRPSVYAVVENMREEYSRFTISEQHPNGKRYHFDNNMTAYFNTQIPVDYPEFRGVLAQRKKIPA